MLAHLFLMDNSYDRIAEQWHANSRGQAYVNHVLGYVDLVLEGLQPGARVLDLGCGTGEPIAAYIIGKGFRVTGVDESVKMLEIARNIVPEAELIHSDMLEVQLPGEFAAAIAWDSVFHVERKNHQTVYRKLASSLETGGRLLLSVGGSDADEGSEGTSPGDSAVEGFTSEMFGQTFFYSGYEPRVARSLLEAEGFQIERWEVDDPSSRGHIVVIGRKIL